MDTSLKKIISTGIGNLSSMFKGDTSKSFLGIDIGSSAIKVVQIKKSKGKAVLETYGALSLGPYGDGEIGTVTNLESKDIARALIDVIKESNVTASSGTISIPSSSSLIFTLTLPAKVNEEQLSTIVPTEARKYIPVPITEVSLDWFIIPPEENKSIPVATSDPLTPPPEELKTEVLVVAIHNDIIARFQDMLSQTSITSNSYEMEIFSIIRSSLDNSLTPTLLMDFGAQKTKISIIEGGLVRVFHIINRGAQDISKNISQALSISFPEAEKLKRSVGLDETTNSQVSDIARLYTDYIFSDTKNVVLKFENKYNKKVEKIILTGGGALLKGLRDKVKSTFDREVILGNPFNKTEAPAFLEEVLQVSGPEFSVAVGLALRELN